MRRSSDGSRAPPPGRCSISWSPPLAWSPRRGECPRRTAEGPGPGRPRHGSATRSTSRSTACGSRPRTRPPGPGPRTARRIARGSRRAGPAARRRGARGGAPNRRTTASVTAGCVSLNFAVISVSSLLTCSAKSCEIFCAASETAPVTESLTLVISSLTAVSASAVTERIAGLVTGHLLVRTGRRRRRRTRRSPPATPPGFRSPRCRGGPVSAV